MRNFGSDSPLASQQLYLNHHQLAPLPNATQSLQHQQQQLAIVSPVVVQPVKMEQYQAHHLHHHSYHHPFTKTVGVGTANLKNTGKSHFSPVSVLHGHSLNPPFPHGGHNGSSSSSSELPPNNTTNSIVPINLSHHPGHSTTATAAMTTTVNPAALSHLPTVALNAACPTPSTRGSSPAHNQPNPVNGMPYHHQSSHSPTLPIAHTALPSEGHSVSSKLSSSSPPSSIIPETIPSTTSSPYPHHVTSFTKMQNTLRSNTNSPSSSSPSLGDQRAANSPNYSSVKSEVTPTQQATSVTNATVPPLDNGSSQNTNSSASNSPASATSAARIVSQNVNGTLAITGIPSNESELQLFRVLQRANLLSYFDMMIELGGDDVQQLCEAGEEEFLEIMALIGMAAKPLHVRRLQKALQEWMTQPNLFTSPVLPPGYQQHYGVSHIDRTISHTQYTTTTIAANVGGNTPPQHPVIPVPHVVSQTAPSYAVEPLQSSNANSSPSDNNSLKGESEKQPKLHHQHQERSSNNSSPTSSSSTLAPTTTTVGLPGQYLQHGSPVVISSASTSQPYNFCSSSSSGQQNLEQNYQNCPSPSGSTSSRSSTVSIRSHHQFHPHRPFSPMENSPVSPCSSESGRSISSCNKHESEPGTTSSELENASSSFSSHHDQTNSTQTLDNSTGTEKSSRVVSRSRAGGNSCCGGSQPSSPRGGIDSPRPSTESVTNRNNNSVSIPSFSSSSSQDFSSLQEHEIQKLAETAMNLVRSLPENVKEPKLSRKIETSSYEYVLRLAEDDPRRMEEIRRVSAIFGKSVGNGDVHGKRSKSGSSVVGNNSVLELAMNEAAAQLCRLVPALLTKRDEIYSLARQVIRESGLPYAVICANSNLPNAFALNNNNNNEIATHGFGTSNVGKGKFEEFRNSPAHEERISHEFAAACKKIKLDMHSSDPQDHNTKKGTVMTSENGMQITEIRNVSRRSPPQENKFVTSTALKRMALVASEYRKNNCKSSVTVRT